MVVGENEKALSLFNKYVNNEKTHKSACMNLLTAYAEKGDYISTNKFIREMKSKYNIPLSINTLNILIRSCYNNIPKMFSLYNTISSHGFKPNSETYNLLLQKSDSKYPSFHTIQKLLEEALKNNVYPQKIVLDQLLIRLAESPVSDLKIILKHQLVILYYIRKMNYKPTLPSYSLLMSECAQLKQCDLGISLFDDLLKNELKPNTYSYTALMNCLAESGKCDLAVKLFTEMQVRGQQPNLITCNTLLLACANAGLIDSVLLILDKMKEVNINPDISTYCRVILGYIRSEKYEDGYKFIDEIIKDKNNHQHILFKSIMYLCSKDGNMNKVMEYIKIMDKNMIILNGKELFSPVNYCIVNKNIEFLNIFLDIYVKRHLIFPERLQYNLLTTFYNDKEYDKVIKYSSILINKLNMNITSEKARIILNSEKEIRKNYPSYTSSILDSYEEKYDNSKSPIKSDNRYSDEEDIFSEEQQIVTPIFDGKQINFIKQ